MRRLVVVLGLVWLAALAMGQAATKIKAGDTLTIVTANLLQYSGDFVVSSDGSITVQVFGRFDVAGKTIPEAQQLIQKRAREFIRDANVTVILKLELPQYVYVVAERISDGAVPWTPGLDVRQVVAKYNTLGPLDSYSAKLYHAGQSARAINLVKLVREGDESQNVHLEAGDVLALLPAASKSVWVLGNVRTPGLTRVQPDDGAARALAAAGGIDTTVFSAAEYKVSLRRGDQTWTRPWADVLARDDWALEQGDTLTVVAPQEVKISVGGFVKQPGVVKVRDGAALLAAVEAAGGVAPTGTLQRTLLFRSGEVTVVDARSLVQGGTDPGMPIKEGDFIYVSENVHDYQLLGFVMRPGRKLIPDSKQVRLSDAVAAGEGLAQRGTFRNIVLMRPDGHGKFSAKRYNLDEFIKKGDLTQNPEIAAGDIVFVDQISGTSLQDLLRFLPNLVLFDRLF
ncbi:MAG: polysaccharide biosynthesis/export family protein [Armatimonadetes bacterium]|nr:polysaccharide biosynthesis/export family protein [Armatimonadota bacterium]